MGDNRLKPLVLSEDERRTLENWVKRRSTAQGLALRARIVLACAQGGSSLAVAARLGVSRNTVGKWREHFLRDRLKGCRMIRVPGVARTITDAQGRLIERWFGYLTDQKIRRGVHKSVQSLEADIRAWIEHWNENPRPFAWTKTAEEILNSLAEYLSKISGGPH